jgi:hypothetical protein
MIFLTAPAKQLPMPPASRWKERWLCTASAFALPGNI